MPRKRGGSAGSSAPCTPENPFGRDYDPVRRVIYMARSNRPVLVPRVVALRVDTRTATKLEKLAADRGITTSDVMRQIVYDALAGRSPIAIRRRTVPNGELLAAILGQLGKTGSNINQLARSVNSGLGVDRAALERALREVSEMSRLVRDLVGGVDDA